MKYVITCGDEGVQLNQGTRLGILGSGIKIPHADKIIGYLKSLFGSEVYLSASEENAWIRQEFALNTWEQANATYQQQAEVIADKVSIPYIGFLEFSDPRPLKHEIKGHMVRPKGIHIANGISLTIGGGEQTYHLGHFVISAEWLHLADKKIAKEFLDAQIEYYKKLVNMPDIKITVEEAGELDPKVIAKNKAILEKLGYV